MGNEVGVEMNYFSLETRKKLIWIAVGFTLIHFCTSSTAMLLYPGGTSTNATTEGYQFFRNFFSDLGRTHDFRGNAQWASCLLFNGGTILLGIGYILMYRANPGMFKAGSVARRWAEFGSLGGMLTGLCFIAVAFTPWDICRGPHMVFVKMGMIGITVAVLAYMIALWMTKDIPSIYFWSYAFLMLAVGLNLYLVFRFNYVQKEEKETIQAIGQKVLGYINMFVLYFQAWGITKYSDK